MIRVRKIPGMIPIPGIGICMKKNWYEPGIGSVWGIFGISVSVRYGGFWAYRYHTDIYWYRFGMGDFGDIGICLNILLTDTDISVSVSVYRYRSNSNTIHDILNVHWVYCHIMFYSRVMCMLK